jgi:CMP-N,N'-diacetyllegionaminic acid synthase
LTLDAIAIIPARGGSKRVPSKNLLPLAGRPLLAHSIEAALAAENVSDVYVSTEDEQIAEVARSHGAQVVMRPAEIASDTATSESALADALDQIAAGGRAEPELVVFLQATSPVRRPGEIDRAIAEP